MAIQLPHLPDVERLSPRVIRILGGNPGKFTLQGTNTYLLGTGSTRLLIDTGQGYPSWRTNLSNLLTTESCTISHALLTHWHIDHVSGVPDLLSLCPRAQIHKHTPSASDHQIAIADGERFSVEGATLRALHCPGHTADHMAFVLEEEGAMFTGDNVLGHGTAVFESLGEYLGSLGKMIEHGGNNGRAYPGHGDVVGDRNGKVEEYLRHRREREGEVVRALEVDDGKADGEGKTAMEIVEVVYKDYPKGLWEPARGGVMQVLWKLEEEGKVREGKEGKWMISGSSERSAL